jgi:hypothetical protein
MYSASEEVNASAAHIPTPNVARMAKNGMKFLRSYSGQVCAPSRTMLMLGKHLGHTTIRGNDGAYTPLLASDITVAKVLQQAGYTTALAGKWGLGNFGTTGYPNAQGFDHFIGQDTQVGCHDWYPLSVCNDTVHEAPINTKADLVYMDCLGPHATCTWANDLDRTEVGILSYTACRCTRQHPPPTFIAIQTLTNIIYRIGFAPIPRGLRSSAGRRRTGRSRSSCTCLRQHRTQATSMGRVQSLLFSRATAPSPGRITKSLPTTREQRRAVVRCGPTRRRSSPRRCGPRM